MCRVQAGAWVCRVQATRVRQGASELQHVTRPNAVNLLLLLLLLAGEHLPTNSAWEALHVCPVWW